MSDGAPSKRLRNLLKLGDLAHAMPPKTHWEHFIHGADIGIRGIGRTKAEAFEQAALAMPAVMTGPT